jgi:2-iminoacetate synthase
VGGYTMGTQQPQFQIEDHRSPIEVTKDLLRSGHIPSFCTACYREGRTGDRFMKLAKNGQIANICGANALLTLTEYAEDYGDDEFRKLAGKVVGDEISCIPNDAVRSKAEEFIRRIKGGERDFRF